MWEIYSSDRRVYPFNQLYCGETNEMRKMQFIQNDEIYRWFWPEKNFLQRVLRELFGRFNAYAESSKIARVSYILQQKGDN